MRPPLYAPRRPAYLCAMTGSPSLAPEKPCPLCGKPAALRFRPFCGKRCADVDLHRWLSGVYAIPVEETADDPSRPRGGEDEDA